MAILPNLMSMVKNLLDLRSPWTSVQSETLQIDRQRRFVLDCKGHILDLQRMSGQTISDYLGDQNELERRQNPGRRHRNWRTVQCSYLYIAGKKRAVESLRRVEESEFPTVKLKYNTVRTGGRPDEMNNNSDNLSGLRSQTHFRRFRQQKGHSHGVEPNPEKKLLLHVHGAWRFSTGE